MKKMFNIIMCIMLCIIFAGCFDNTKTKLESMIELNSDFLAENDNIENVIQIDDNNYIIIIKENNEENDYTLCNYNTDNGAIGPSLQVDMPFEYVGIDKDDKLLVFLFAKSSIDKNAKNEIVYVDYENMEIKQKINEENNNSDFIISANGELMAFCNMKGMFVRNLTTNEEKLLFNHSIDMENIIESELYIPIEIIENKIIYRKMNYEWVEGFGIIEIDGRNNVYTECRNSQYLYYDEIRNDIYYAEIFEPREIYKVNMNNKKVEKTFTITDELKGNITNRYLHFANNLNYMLSYETFIADNISSGRLEVKSLDTGKTVAVYEFEPEENFSISNLYFAGNDIFFNKANKLFIWKYLE